MRIPCQTKASAIKNLWQPRPFFLRCCYRITTLWPKALSVLSFTILPLLQKKTFSNCAQKLKKKKRSRGNASASHKRAAQFEKSGNCNKTPNRHFEINRTHLKDQNAGISGVWWRNLCVRDLSFYFTFLCVSNWSELSRGGGGGGEWWVSHLRK